MSRSCLRVNLWVKVYPRATQQSQITGSALEKEKRSATSLHNAADYSNPTDEWMGTSVA